MVEDMSESEAKPCTFHPQESTRLSCTECETPICPKCMVMYEAGFKCPTCAKKRVSHVARLTPRQGLALIALSMSGGFLYGWLHPWVMGLPFRPFGLPVLALLGAYWMGRLLGSGIQRLLRYKYGLALAGGVAFCALLGLVLNPFIGAGLLDFLAFLASASGYAGGTAIFYYLLGPQPGLIGLVVFLKGLSRKFQGPD